MIKMRAETASIIKNLRRQTNWYVITGGPGSGKTTTVNLLKERGYITTIEHARHYLDTQRLKGKTVEEVRKNQLEFQLGILDMQIERKNQISPDVLVFLDRAIPDALAYYRFLNLPEDKKLLDLLPTVFYKKIFILDTLPLKQDYARKEDEAAQKEIHALLIEVYECLPLPIIRISVLEPDERVDFLLKNIEKSERMVDSQPTS